MLMRFGKALRDRIVAPVPRPSGVIDGLDGILDVLGPDDVMGTNGNRETNTAGTGIWALGLAGRVHGLR